MLAQLTFTCRNASRGCTELLPYEKLSDHEASTCNFELMQCQGRAEGCDALLLRSAVEAHQAECPFVPTECDFCKKLVRRAGVRAHLLNCEETEVECEFCGAAVRKKNYLVHLNAQCEEYVMSCGRCSGTYKRKFKNFHDCVRNLQNQCKTLSEAVGALKDQLHEKDKRLLALEKSVSSEIQALKQELQRLRSDNHLAASQLGALSQASSHHFAEPMQFSQSPTVSWDAEQCRLFRPEQSGKEAVF